MNNVLILQNVTRESGGLIETMLEERGSAYRTVNLDRGEEIPALDDFGLLIVLGGPDSANDAAPKIQFELKAIKDWIERDRPYLGVCLGLQLMVKAAGGKVLKAKEKELGFHDSLGKPYRVRLTEQGLQDPLFKGMPHEFPVFQLHGETVELTREMVLIGAGEGCVHQVVRFRNNVYGIQCHIEVTRELLEVWTREDDDLKDLKREEIIGAYSTVQQEYERSARIFLSNFFEIADKVKVSGERL